MRGQTRDSWGDAGMLRAPLAQHTETRVALDRESAGIVPGQGPVTVDQEGKGGLTPNRSLAREDLYSEGARCTP